MPYLIALLVVGLLFYGLIQLFIRSDAKVLAKTIRAIVPWLIISFSIIAFLLGRTVLAALLVIIAVFYYLWAKNYQNKKQAAEDEAYKINDNNSVDDDEK